MNRETTITHFLKGYKKKANFKGDGIPVMIRRSNRKGRHGKKRRKTERKTQFLREVFRTLIAPLMTSEGQIVQRVKPEASSFTMNEKIMN
jgi:hypothetical protein